MLFNMFMDEKTRNVVGLEDRLTKINADDRDALYENTLEYNTTKGNLSGVSHNSKGLV
jgi:hypothetical protein